MDTHQHRIDLRFYLFILLVLVIAGNSKAQCPFSLGPDICQTPPINLTLNGPPGYTSYAWNTGSTTQNTAVTAPGTYFCTATKVSGNLIANGDFSAGNSGFSSNYVEGKGGTFGPLSQEGTYAVGNNPTAQHSHFPSFGDHTTGTGNMMIINGDPNANANIWCQSIPVTPNTTYNFSTWVATCVAVDAAQIAQLQFSVNGTLMGPVFSPVFTPGQWSQFSTVWNSGNATSANICIVNQNTVTQGNDFAIDDIFFQNVCIFTDTVTVYVPLAITADAGPDQTVCIGSPVQLNAVLAGAAVSGTWSGGMGTFTPNNADPKALYTPNPAEIAAGTVVLTFTVSNGLSDCPLTDDDSMIIRIDQLLNVNAGADQTICTGNTVQLAATIGGVATGGSWSGGTGTYVPDKTDPKAIYTPSAGEALAGKVTLTYTAVNGNNSSCTGVSDEMIIHIDPLPTVDAGSDLTICFGGTANLTGTIGGSATSGFWSGGAGVYTPGNSSLTAAYTPALAEMNAGWVTLILTTNGMGTCPSVNDTVNIRILPLAVIDAGPHQVICAGNTATLTGTISGGVTTGSWSGGSGTFTPDKYSLVVNYTPTKADEDNGKVVLVFTSDDPPGPCNPVSDTVSVIIHKRPTANAGDPRFICEGETIKLSGSVGGGATMGTWSGGMGTYINSNTDLVATYIPTPAEIAAGKVTLTLTSNSTGVCPIITSQVTHIIYPKPVIHFAVDTPKACPPHCVDFEDSSAAGSTNIVKWDWDFGNGKTGSGKTQKDICYEKPGFYDVKLTVTSDKNCMSTLSVSRMIETFPKPVAQFTATPNPVSVFDPLVHFQDQSTPTVKFWRWNFGDGTILSPSTQHPSHKYETEIASVYQVQLYITDTNGCVDSITKPIEIHPEFSFFIPNAFTPQSNDGINDTFFGKGVGIVEYRIHIFDRWGNMVFTTTDLNEGWDGRVNNGTDIAQQDVFVWKVELKDIFGKKHQYIGTVTLVK
jgi:gliding motility-associated-like protein